MTKKKNNNLVIVESPAKARTLSRILGSDYNLKASLGHVRDLPRSKLGVDTENSFLPSYVIPRGKSKIARELREAAKNASTIYLATDPDREGEAISWHLLEVIKSNKKPYHRVVFHEITEEAIENAFKHPRSIDMQLVNAQQARRVLDRLVGYKLSPLLWKKVRRGLSAGRVQSVALRIIVEREREIEAFIPEEYWTIEAELSKKTSTDKEPSFRAMLVSLLNGDNLSIPDQEKADEITNELEGARYSVLKIKTKKVTRQPAPPFITSTLQQEAWRRLRFSAAQTMAIAQQLYEGLSVGSKGSVGLITYMRTDSTRVARSAIVEARAYIKTKYGETYLPPHVRSFTRVVKGAQEAHEAIRPTSADRTPESLKKDLEPDLLKLYTLIWNRFVASQMEAAVFDTTSADIEAGPYTFRATGSVLKSPGWLAVYHEAKEEDTTSKDDEPEDDEDRQQEEDVVGHHHGLAGPHRLDAMGRSELPVSPREQREAHDGEGRHVPDEVGRQHRNGVHACVPGELVQLDHFSCCDGARPGTDRDSARRLLDHNLPNAPLLIGVECVKFALAADGEKPVHTRFDQVVDQMTQPRFIQFLLIV